MKSAGFFTIFSYIFVFLQLNHNIPMSYSYMAFPKPKANKFNNRQRLYISTEEFMKLIPKETSTEQAVKLYKTIQETETERKLTEKLTELKLQMKDYENELKLQIKDYESEIKYRNQEILFLTQKILSSNFACTSRGIFEYVLKAANSELKLPKNFNARSVCDQIIACKPLKHILSVINLV